MITQSRLKELVSYDSLTGIFAWNKNIKGGAKTGEQVGSIFNTGYVYLGLDGKSYTAHRMAWLYVYGILPKLLDHINRDRTDNRLCNLRSASHSENGHNSNLKSTNTSGYTGVSKVREKWNAYITVDRKRFNLGYFKTPEAANTAYMKAKALHGR